MAMVDNSKLFLFKDEYWNNLNNSEKKNLFCDDYYRDKFSKINGQIYYVKKKNIRYIINELLGELIANYFNVDSVKYILSVGEDSRYILLSKLFDVKLENYARINDVFCNLEIERNIGLDNFNNLNKYVYDGKVRTLSKDKLEKLQESIKKMLILDFMMGQVDRHRDNYLFYVNSNIVKLLPLFDYELCFRNRNNFFDILDFDLSLDKVINFIKRDSFFQKLLYKSLDLDMNIILEELQDKNPIILEKKEYDEYKTFVDNKKKLIKEYKLLR